MESWIVVIVVVVVVLGVGAWLAAKYNGLVALRNRAEQAWADIDVMLTRRHDLIPNLVETVKGYASHERDTLEAVIQARNTAVSATGPRDQAAAEVGLTGALRQLFAVAEAYPDLKADQNFRELQQELTSTEDGIATARRTYNANVQVYDTEREQFPTNIIAGIFNFEEMEYFTVDDPESREPVKVEF
ncbi:MAG TPA: LemA family protein [Nitriliruptoraceae bacterium]|nr:LemA family protein [Nitriliruptoraceae bacterium]